MIIIEGCDLVGKTTLAGMLKEALPPANTLVVHFPIFDDKSVLVNDEIIVFRKIAESLKGLSMHEIQDIMFQNIIDNTPILLDLERRGISIILDRYILSNLVYRSAFDIPLPDISKYEEVLKALTTSLNLVLIADMLVIEERLNAKSNILEQDDNTSYLEKQMEKLSITSKVNDIYSNCKDILPNINFQVKKWNHSTN